MEAEVILEKFDTILWGLSLPPDSASARTHSRSWRVCISFISAADIKDTWAAALLGSGDVIS